MSAQVWQHRLHPHAPVSVKQDIRAVQMAQQLKGFAAQLQRTLSARALSVAQMWVVSIRIVKLRGLLFYAICLKIFWGKSQ
jgi:hypothetical protein